MGFFPINFHFFHLCHIRGWIQILLWFQLVKLNLIYNSWDYYYYLHFVSFLNILVSMKLNFLHLICFKPFKMPKTRFCIKIGIQYHWIFQVVLHYLVTISFFLRFFFRNIYPWIDFFISCHLNKCFLNIVLWKWETSSLRILPCCLE